MEMMTKRMNGLQLASVSTQSQDQMSNGVNQLEESFEPFTYEQQGPEQVQYINNTSSSFQHDSYGDTYNLAWRNHPNLRWDENQKQGQRNSKLQQFSQYNHNQPTTNNNQFRKSQNTHFQPQNNFFTLAFNTQHPFKCLKQFSPTTI
ncbi:uncharacterized protein DS421_18g624420 [Arachis hypogaea]|nr:uncharacterized protein DS421_18g624420 [Arachis hypogaea]